MHDSAIEKLEEFKGLLLEFYETATDEKSLRL